MPRTQLLLLSVLLAAACAPVVDDGNTTVDINAAALQAQGAVDAYGARAKADAPVEIADSDAPKVPAAVAAKALVPLDPPAPGTPGGLPDDRTPLSEAPFTPDSAQGAANVVQTYYALIGEGKYRDAFALRDSTVVGPKTADTFAADFARYSEYHANVGGPSAIDAGAGQRSVTVPVQIYARLKEGQAPVYHIWSVTLHRTQVDGASAQQRRWHIRTIMVKAAPRG
jgi:hypothetical protein